MLKNKRPLGPTDNPQLVNIRDVLVVKKLLVKQADTYLFHDRVRAWLAGRHFESQWRDLLKGDSVRIDRNWEPMLEFVFWDFEAGRLGNSTSSEWSLNVLNPAETEANQLLHRILEINIVVAATAFAWLANNLPTLCSAWRRAFEGQLGRALAGLPIDEPKVRITIHHAEYLPESNALIMILDLANSESKAVQVTDCELILASKKLAFQLIHATEPASNVPSFGPFPIVIDPERITRGSLSFRAPDRDLPLSADGRSIRCDLRLSLYPYSVVEQAVEIDVFPNASGGDGSVWHRKTE
jgi:hypothetical protein